METVTFKVDDAFAKDIDSFMKKHNYVTKTEFIRESIREKMETAKKIEHIQSIYGTSKRKTTDKQLHDARERAMEELSRTLS